MFRASLILFPVFTLLSITAFENALKFFTNVGWKRLKPNDSVAPKSLKRIIDSKNDYEEENKSIISTSLFFCASKHVKALGDTPVDSTDWFQPNVAEVDLHVGESRRIQMKYYYQQQ